MINPATGKVTIPAPACETPAAKAVRENVLNQLDGFGTYEAAMQVTFTSPVDPASLEGNVVMFERKQMGADVSPSAATPVPLVFKAGNALRFDPANCQAAPAVVPAVNIIPAIPLDQKSTYTVAILDGIKTTDGTPFIASPTWALVRQSTDPVTLADGCDYTNPTSCTVIAEKTPFDPANPAELPKIVGLDQLWKAEAQGLAFLDATGHSDRSKVLVAWEVTTQTVTDPLDATVPGSPASMVPTGAFVPGATHSVVQGGNTRNFLEAVYEQLLGLSPQDAQALCNQIGCDNVGDVLGTGLGEMNFQTHVMNPYSGAADIPGPWSNPVTPEEQDPFSYLGPTGPAGVIPVLAFVPAGTPPPNGWPVVVFGHGLGSQKESLFVIAPQLASAGFASVAIDFVDHGARAVRVTADPALGCAGHCSVTTTTTCSHDADCGNETCQLPGFSAARQCFAPFLSTDLAGTRDNIRETVLDLQRLTHAVKACGTTACGTFQVDPTHVEYAGISLGGIIGTTTTATDADIKASVLNVPGVGLVDILENSETLEIKCPLVNGLIDAGIIQGTKWDPANPTVGTCLTDDWKMQPGYQQFSAIARIVLDPADGANFTRQLATRRFLIQEVIGDKVVPNIATNNEGMLVGLMPQQADPMASPSDPPSAAILGNSPPTTAMTSKWLQYPTLPADPNTSFPGNTFAHASLLAPANNNADGKLGTARLRKDAITYLLFNK